jgi:SAM-dependent methyltransferase
VTDAHPPKPEHLGQEYAAQFRDESVAKAYIHRPTHPRETFDFLLTLMPGPARRVLDLGCGTGIIARELAPLVDHVDAVDFSTAMIAEGRQLPGGDHAKLSWICSSAETFIATEPYDLITCGDAIHWFDWPIVFLKLRAMLKHGADLALLGVEATTSHVIDLLPLIQHYSTNQKFSPYNLLDEFSSRGCFTIAGEKKFSGAKYLQPVDDFIESIHARNGFSRQRMTPNAARDFDAAVRSIVERAYPTGKVELRAISTVTWGQPNDVGLLG